MDKNVVYRTLKIVIACFLVTVITIGCCPQILVENVTLGVIKDLKDSQCTSTEFTGIRSVVKKREAPSDETSASLKPQDVDNVKDTDINVAVKSSGLLSQKVVSVKREEDCVKRLPKCLIIGVQKCGTKALAEFLNVHPQIAINSTQTYFFSANYSRGYSWYLDQLPCSRSDQITIERTPQYFYFDYVPARVFAANPDMKLLLIVKNPFTRTVSNFAMAQYRDREPSGKQLEKRIFLKNTTGVFVRTNTKYVAKSRYADYIQNWLRYFPRNQIHIIDGYRFTKNPSVELAKVESFLGIKHFIKPKHFVFNVESGFHCLKRTKGKTRTSVSCLPKTKGRTHQTLSKGYMTVLKNYFASENERFFSIVKHRYDW